MTTPHDINPTSRSLRALAALAFGFALTLSAVACSSDSGTSDGGDTETTEPVGS